MFKNSTQTKNTTSADESFTLEMFKSNGRNTTSTADDTGFKGVARIMEKSGIVVLILPLVVGVITIIINSVQLWTFKTKFKRELNSLFVILRHLCIADLLNGVVTLSQTMLSVIEWKFLPGNMILMWLTEFVNYACLIYVFLCSTVLMNCLTLLKMILVTKNCWYTRATVGKICKGVWSLIFFVVSVGYVISKTGAISSDGKMIFRRIWVPLCTSISFIFQCYCLGRIFYRARHVNNKVPQRADRRTRTDGNFVKIAIFQIVSYMVCVGPLSTYQALPLLCDFKVKRHFNVLFGVLAYLNSIIDPVVFFVVYRHKWRRPKRHQSSRGHDIRLSYITRDAGGENQSEG